VEEKKKKWVRTKGRREKGKKERQREIVHD
jgi:hypothetical protein